MQAETNLVELRSVSKTYGVQGTPGAVHALRGINLIVPAGGTVAIVGPSGSGKSSLLNIIGALDEPTSGDVIVNGRDVLELDEIGRDAYRGRMIGFIFQRHHLLPSLTAFENTLVPVLPLGRAAVVAAEERSARMLAAMGLGNRLDALPRTLSMGECQRVAVVRALINHPQLLLADEPTGALDHANANAMVDILLRVQTEEKVAIIMVTHATALARRMAVVYTMEDGRLRPGCEGG
ncbi:MAG: ABC transporter ATP-binding protein [bacterium]